MLTYTTDHITDNVEIDVNGDSVCLKSKEWNSIVDHLHKGIEAVNDSTFMETLGKMSFKLKPTEWFRFLGMVEEVGRI